MNKKQRILIGIALMFPFTGIALATSINLSASSSDVVIYAFDQKPHPEAIKVKSPTPLKGVKIE